MKRKQIVIAVLVMVLLFGMSVHASSKAEQASKTAQAVYPTTASFMKVMDADNLKYDYLGLTEDEDEEIYIRYSGDYMETVAVDIFFDKDCDVVSLRSWDVITYDESSYVDVLQVINDLNYTYKFVTFVADETDHTVYVAVDAPLRDCEEAGEIAYDCLYYIVEITDESFNELAQFNK